MEEAEAYAALALKEAKMDGHDNPDPRLVVRRHKVGLYRAPKSARWSELGERIWVNSEPRIYVRADVEEPRRSHVIAHEFGHIIVDRFGLQLEDVEGWCNRFAAALLVPEPAVWSRWQRFRDVRKFLQAWNDRAPTLLALRLGECRCVDVWVTEGRRVLYARADRQAPPNIITTGLEAARDGLIERPELRAVRLPDGSRRAAVWLSEAA